MGTVGKMEEFGQKAADRIEDLGSDVSARLDDFGDKMEVEDRSRREGDFTRRIEKLTAALPSSTWLALAGGSLVGSLVLKLLDRHEAANFVADWVPTFLLIGIYNKLVKIAGSDRQSAF